MLIRYLDAEPRLGTACDIATDAAAIGRTTSGPRLTLRALAALRGDGEAVNVGADVHFAERSTAHIAHATLAANVGDRVTVGRFGLVHACTLEEGVVVADGATVMDATTVGPYAVIGPGSLVPPRKQLPGGFLYQGNPVTPLREIAREEAAAAALAIRAGRPSALTTAEDLPPLDLASFVPEGPFTGCLHAIHGRSPAVGAAFVAPNCVVVGDVRVGDEAGIYFGCVVSAGDGRIVIGARSNVQDNSLLVTDRGRGDLVIGERVTVGHNVRLGSGRIEDDALVGMASRVGDGVVVERGGCIAAGAWVEPGTVVRAGWIWAGRPAREFRALKPAEREWFAQGTAIYVEYARGYRSAGLR